MFIIEVTLLVETRCFSDHLKLEKVALDDEEVGTQQLPNGICETDPLNNKNGVANVFR